MKKNLVKMEVRGEALVKFCLLEARLMLGFAPQLSGGREYLYNIDSFAPYGADESLSGLSLELSYEFIRASSYEEAKEVFSNRVPEGYPIWVEKKNIGIYSYSTDEWEGDVPGEYEYIFTYPSIEGMWIDESGRVHPQTHILSASQRYIIEGNFDDDDEVLLSM